MKKMNEATLNLFKAIQVDHKSNEMSIDIKNGLLYIGFTPNKDMVSDAVNVLGVSGEKLNKSFHKSWETIENTPQEDLWFQAAIHYLTTYGLESIDLYSEDTIFIPSEKLDIPEINEHCDIRLILVKGLTRDDILSRIIDLAGSGIALSQKTLDDILLIVEKNKYDVSFVGRIKNKELVALLNDFYGIVPSDPVEFLRYLVSKITGESLLIKNRYLIEKIKSCDSRLHARILDEELKKAPDNLAEIFFRFKPIFLALKSISHNKTFFNRLRKQADVMHKPMKSDYLNQITEIIKRGDAVNVDKLKNALDNASVFRKIRLANALKYRMSDVSSIIYKVRNGAGWVDDFEFKNKSQISHIFDYVYMSIVRDLDVHGKTFFIPANMNYAIPATEKQFTSNLPSGSYVSIPDDMIIGIYWEDVNGKRIDLDLSMLSQNEKVGWDRSYTSEEKGILFSGDMTAAPHGATELFYVKTGDVDPNMLFLNYFNYQKGVPVQAKIVIAHDTQENFGKNYMIDQNNLLASADIVVEKQQNMLGLVMRVNDENRFYFSQSAVGNSISSSNDPISEMAREYLVNSCINTLSFNDVLADAGANIVHDYVDGAIDLSQEIVDKATFINVLNKA